MEQVSEDKSTYRSTATRVKAAAILRRFGNKTFVREMLLNPDLRYIYRGNIVELDRELKKEFGLPPVPSVSNRGEKGTSPEN